MSCVIKTTQNGDQTYLFLKGNKVVKNFLNKRKVQLCTADHKWREKKEEAVNSRKDGAGHDLIALTIFLKSCISTEHTHSVHI